jgi:hypothetical protein
MQGIVGNNPCHVLTRDIPFILKIKNPAGFPGRVKNGYRLGGECLTRVSLWGANPTARTVID